ncbi:MAG: hypothetical protein R6U11_10780, partial [Bacteroidales bacterium]
SYYVLIFFLQSICSLTATNRGKDLHNILKDYFFFQAKIFFRVIGNFDFRYSFILLDNLYQLIDTA